jgi:transcriptional regulator with XRE-family HTH domain
MREKRERGSIQMKTMKKDVTKQFGEFIKDTRESQGLTQMEVAEKADIKQPYLSQLEQGDRVIDLHMAMALCDAVGVDLKDFLIKYKK